MAELLESGESLCGGGLRRRAPQGLVARDPNVEGEVEARGGLWYREDVVVPSGGEEEAVARAEGRVAHLGEGEGEGESEGEGEGERGDEGEGEGEAVARAEGRVAHHVARLGEAWEGAQVG